MRTWVDVAFCNNMRKVVKRSYNKTIDVTFGIYEGKEHEGWLAISLKPSKGTADWLINLIGYLTPPMMLDGGWVHRGYWKEITHYWPEFIGVIYDTPELAKAMQKGVIISGRSKGAAEAVLIAYRMWTPSIKMEVGAVEPPRFCSYQLAKRIEGTIGRNIITYTIYKNDIVPGVPKWFTIPGFGYQIGKRKAGLSIKDHIEATTKQEVIDEGLKPYEAEYKAQAHKLKEEIFKEQ